MFLKNSPSLRVLFQILFAQPPLVVKERQGWVWRGVWRGSPLTEKKEFLLKLLCKKRSKEHLKCKSGDFSCGFEGSASLMVIAFTVP